MEKNLTFEPVLATEPVIELPAKIVQEMSTDASLSYRLLSAIRTGQLQPELATMKCGKLNHTRWLTTGQSLMMLWMSKHGLTGETLRRFRMIIEYVCNIYFHMFYEIKVKHNILDGPKHLITLLCLLRSQQEEVVKIFSPYI